MNKIGIDKAIYYLLMGRGISLISQSIIIFSIAKFFSENEQGFYYTFNNILATSIFLELGLGYVLTQFASHEFAHLTWNPDGSLAGNEKSLSRIITILRKSIKWYGILSTVFILVIIPIGILFFGSSRDSINVNYIIPWISLVFFSSLSLFIYPISSVIEGCGKVVELQKMRFYQLFIGGISIWMIIFLGGKLFAASIVAFTNFSISVFWIYRNFEGLIHQLRQVKEIKEHQILWKKEIFPMQWRIALSWMSGYFIFQLFNPLLFKYQSPTVAGQMGMSLSIANLVLSICMAWVSTKIPLYGSLIKKKNFKYLDKLAFQSTIQALLVSIILSVIILLFIYCIKVYFPIYGARVLNMTSLSSLFFSNIINVIIFSIAGYLRAFKEEPFLINSIIGALLTSIIAFVCSKYYNANILCISIAIMNSFMGLPWAIYILHKKRIELKIVKITNN